MNKNVSIVFLLMKNYKCDLLLINTYYKLNIVNKIIKK